MNCQFCSKEFNLNNKPFMLLNCAHTICAECESNAGRKCPNCKAVIERSLVNLIVLNSIENKPVIDQNMNIIENESDFEPEAKSKINLKLIS